MELTVNGQPESLATGSTMSALLTHLSFTNRRIAIEVNQEIVPRSNYGRFQLHEGDRVEIVHAIGGG